MWLYLLSLLVIGSVQSATIGYPYRSLWTYDPVKGDTIHGYLRYLDNNAAGGIIGFNNHQPVYTVRQIKYVNSATPALETVTIQNSDELKKAREAYLRAASLQQYQNLKSDIDGLKAEGKEPSAEKLSKLQMLEKIAFTSDFSLIAELPEVRSTLRDLEASISSLYRESVQQSSNQRANIDQRQGEIKTYVGNSDAPQVAIKETPEQKQAREDHLRIYKEQIAQLKQLELEHQKYVQEASSKSHIPKNPNEKVENSKALAEWERAQQEHFRLWNEAKLRAEKADSENGEKEVHETANKQQISALKNDQNIYSSKHAIPNNQETQQSNKQFEQQNVEHTPQFSGKSQQIQSVEQIPAQHQVVDTPEVMRAREEHLRIVNEAILRAQTEPQSEQKQIYSKEEKTKVSSESIGQQISSDQEQNLKGSSPALNYRAEQSFVEETPEVKKAREEHLRLVQEANVRAQYVEQQELKYKHETQTPILKSQYEHRHQNVEGALQAGQFNSYAKEQNEKSVILPNQLQQQQQTFGIQNFGETPEVQRAREEHLRIFNSIKSHAEQEQAKQNSRSFPPNFSLQQQSTSDFSSGEDRVLELERLREAERLQKEQQQLEMDRLREAERLAEEKRQMEAELMRLRLEEEQRLEMERLLEERRLKEEQEELQKQRNGQYQEIIIQNESVDQQPQIQIISSIDQARIQQKSDIVEPQGQQYDSNSFSKAAQVSSERANPLEPSVNQQSSLLKTIPLQVPSNTYQPNALTSNKPVISNDNSLPGGRYIQSTQHSTGSKQQYIKDNNIKHNYHNTVSSQPADTAVALIALEKATNDHFRAHELALEQLRLARLQNTAVKDCN